MTSNEGDLKRLLFVLQKMDWYRYVFKEESCKNHVGIIY